ncbi:MAG: PfkB family carbohydrate kinase [Anaerolineaceae bacterium]|nr:PfkB family carbohydrate kinase [Anaerolineaceae bacterium]
MQLRENYRYALLMPTSMGVRITPLDRQPVHTSSVFYMQSTSAESNVGQIAASLGMRVKLLTAFVEGSPVARFIKDELRKRNLEYEGPDLPQGGPWGYRHQFNIADSGFGLRGPLVWNDRAGELGCTLNADYYDLKRIFEDEGVGIVHFSGLIAAMSESTALLCLQLARLARANGSLVSFDLNYRSSFWAGREESLRKVFNELASQADILIGNEEEFQLALGFQGPEIKAEGFAEKLDSFKEMAKKVRLKYPQCKVLANTLRQEESANAHLWGAILWTGDEWYLEKPRLIPVLDRIGGGDGFVGGLLYSILKNWEPEKWLHFAWAAGCMAVTVLQDYAQPLSEAQVWSVYQGNARVKR